jgi:hypothetical protein
MTSDDQVQVLKDAISKANINSDAKFDYEVRPEIEAAVMFTNVFVTYRDGNEYLRLDTLLDTLREKGKVEFFEFRGRGSREPHVLAIQVRLDGQRCQLIYNLPTSES